MKFDDLVSLVLEANLYNKDKLLTYINSLLERKNVQKQQIKDWFLKQYVGWYISSKDDTAKYNAGEISPHSWEEGQPEWAKKSDIMYFNLLTAETRDYLGHVIDYFNQLDENELNKIYKKPYEVVQREVAEWDEYLGSRRYKGPPLEEGIDVETVMKFNNGYRWEKLITQQAYTAEGEMMGHCVGGYCEDKNSVIYSLKDPKGDSHATIEYQVKAKGITQIKGRGNEAPVKKYWPYVKDFITKFNFNVLEDGENVGMVTVHAIDETGFRTEVYAFKDSPKYQEILNNSKKFFNTYVKNILLDAEDNDGEIKMRVDLEKLDLDKLPNFSQLKVNDDFDISYNNLTSLKGCPFLVRFEFNCNNNKLKNLEGGPKIIEWGSAYYASHNEITSLKGFPLEFSTRTFKVFLDDNKIEDIDLNDIPQLKPDYDYLTAVQIFVRNNPISDEKIHELNRRIREEYGKTEIRIFGGIQI